MTDSHVDALAPTPAEPPSPSHRQADAAPAFSKREVAIGAACAALGLILGVVLSIGAASVVNVTQSLAAGSPMDDAVTACEIPKTSPWIVVGDDGQSISMKSDGAESQGADLEDIVCVLDQLDTPDSVTSRMGSTRALDGRQDAEWNDLSASWGYHPDDGLDMVVEVVQ